jgi:hypothetical protein
MGSFLIPGILGFGFGVADNVAKNCPPTVWI